MKNILIIGILTSMAITSCSQSDDMQSVHNGTLKATAPTITLSGGTQDMSPQSGIVPSPVHISRN